jgi:hypothetical protein
MFGGMATGTPSRLSDEDYDGCYVYPQGKRTDRLNEADVAGRLGSRRCGLYIV